MQSSWTAPCQEGRENGFGQTAASLTTDNGECFHLHVLIRRTFPACDAPDLFDNLHTCLPAWQTSMHQTQCCTNWVNRKLSKAIPAFQQLGVTWRVLLSVPLPVDFCPNVISSENPTIIRPFKMVPSTTLQLFTLILIFVHSNYPSLTLYLIFVSFSVPFYIVNCIRVGTWQVLFMAIYSVPGTVSGMVRMQKCFLHI